MARFSYGGVGALACALLVVACGSSDGGGAGAAGGHSGGAGGGSSGGSPSSSAGSSAGGASSAGAGNTSSCTDLKLDVGASGPHGTVALYKTSSILDQAGGLGLVGSDIYFVSNDKLQHVPSAGGAAVVVGPFTPSGVVLSGSTLVWFESPVAPATTLRILSAPVSDISNPTVVAEGVTQPQQIAADADTLFFDSRSPENIFSVPIGGGTPKNLVPGSSPLGMISDGTNLYWLDFASSQLERVPKAGGTPVNLAGIFFGGPMAREASNIYWADTSQNSINRWATGDTMVTDLWDTGDFFDAPDSIIVSNSAVYWTQGDFCTGLWQLSSGQSAAQLVVNGFQEGSVFAADSAHVYVDATDGIYRVDR